MKITPFLPDKTKCAKKENHGHCCCNCKFHIGINGHPWVTRTPISKPTGMYVCTHLAVTGSPDDRMSEFIASHKHGACETWAPKPKRVRV